MTATQLEHANIRTTRLEETVRFYTEVLGLRQGYRPSSRPGAWIYDRRDVPVIHISFADPSNPETSRYLDEYLGPRDLASLFGSGAIDHLAFAAEDYDGFCRHLQARGIEYRRRTTDAGLRQIFVLDPNGISVELNFHE